ncbi:MAG: RNA pseudouridine synthase [Planctomycetota bacterium]|nr:RNA pseudouridine synthase [Planctomycetota bacterium]MDA1106570.1 RNA pseudouridine synthase [Planctomycetota bacterium]
MATEPSPPIAPDVLLRTERWIALAKPAGWHSVQQAGSSERTVEAWLREHEAWSHALPEAGLIHRLDQGTSGCLVAACDEESRAHLRDAFAGRPTALLVVKKHYLARLSRAVDASGEFAGHFAGRHKRSMKVTVSAQGESSTRGVCRWRAIDASRTLVEVELIGPGRRHQIRAGFASFGAPLVGDELYGGPAAACGHHLLHAWLVNIGGIVVQAPRPCWAEEDVRAIDSGAQ